MPLEMAGVAQADGVDPDFEFDAPRYYDFEAKEPESPSQTDSWFDTEGPTGELFSRLLV